MIRMVGRKPKLTDAQVREIIAARKLLRDTLAVCGWKALARHYGVSVKTVLNVVTLRAKISRKRRALEKELHP